jgi:hypothetical protein
MLPEGWRDLYRRWRCVFPSLALIQDDHFAATDSINVSVPTPEVVTRGSGVVRWSSAWRAAD